MSRHSFRIRLLAFFLLLIFAQKAGIGMCLHNIFHGNTAKAEKHNGNKALSLVSAATEIGLITSRYDLQSGANTSARKNSGAWGFVSASGGGFLGNRPLYIGARTGNAYYFGGRLYGLILRGTQSTLSQIEATELYMKKKVGIA